MPIGPQLPPGVGGRSSTPSDDSDDGGFGPALPPELAAKRAVGPARPGPQVGPQPPGEAAAVGPERPPGPSVGPSRPPGPSVGPSRPPGPTAGPSRPGPAPPDPESDSDDDFVGPRLSDATASEGDKRRSAVDEFREREARWARERAEEAAAGPKAPQRDEWMLAPPPGGGVLGGLGDPLKRPTAFQKSAKPTVTPDEQRVWTETPAQRAAREADERAGVAAPVSASHAADDRELKRRREKDDAMRRQIADHSKNSRGASLLDQHQAKKKKAAADGEEDDAPAIWDHDKMMGITGRLLTDQERSKKIKDARQLNDRFGHGKGGAYM